EHQLDRIQFDVPSADGCGDCPRYPGIDRSLGPAGATSRPVRVPPLARGRRARLLVRRHGRHVRGRRGAAADQVGQREGLRPHGRGGRGGPELADDADGVHAALRIRLSQWRRHPAQLRARTGPVRLRLHRLHHRHVVLDGRRLGDLPSPPTGHPRPRRPVVRLQHGPARPRRHVSGRL
ncbi:MAG: hypothetical protein AVDCRST_MAG87-3005, partial [uncultured Thermomicrobiales bacterium]